MSDEIVTLTAAQRQLVEATIRKHCEIRRWQLHAVNVRTNHVHVVVTAGVEPEVVMSQLKAWCSRRLSVEAGLAASEKGTKNGLKKWWTQHGSTKWINDPEYLRNSIIYVREKQ
jgi:REP element-mobilizing transposase RayT